MNERLENKKPATWAQSKKAGLKNAFNKNHINKNLPEPKEYFLDVLDNPRIYGNQIISHCRFHNDRYGSLKAYFDGSFKCDTCHMHGSSIASFHSLRFNVSFKKALQVLTSWRLKTC